MSLVCGAVKMSFAPDGASAYRTERGRRGRSLSVQPLPHSSQGAAPDGAFLRSLSRPNLAPGSFHPATPLPDAEVSFLTGDVIHQAGMEQRSGFEPPLPAWKAGVLTVEH